MTRAAARWTGLVSGAAAACACLALAAPATAATDRGEEAVIPGSFIVVYEPEAGGPGTETAQRERRLGFDREQVYRHAVEGFVAELEPRQVRALRADPEVDFVSRNRRVEASDDLAAQAVVPLTPGESPPPVGVRRIDAATGATVREPGANTAVIDTGIDLDHPDLNAVSGTDCIDPGTSAEDGDGHGTHVAGTIGATNDGAGLTGVAPGTKLYAVRVLDDLGNGTTASVICGIDWVTANHGARGIEVANMSLGGTGAAQGSETCANTTDPMRRAVCESTAAGVRHVVAAGNDGWDFDHALQPDVPAAYPEVLTVTAIADSDGAGGGVGPDTGCSWGVPDDTPAPFSNFARTPAGAAHTIAAPGVCVTSTVPGGGEATYSGTSMASPHVAGVVALCVSEAGASGPCAARTPAETIDWLRADAEAQRLASPLYGFSVDPADAPDGDYYGFLTRASQLPFAHAGGPYRIAEGDSLRLAGSGAGAPGTEAAYSWDVNGDGVFGDAAGAGPTLSWSELEALGLGDGPRTVANARLRVSGGAAVSTSPATKLTVENRAPALAIAGPSSAVAGADAGWTLTATDPSAADRAAGFAFALDWDGDGAVEETASGRSPLTVEHAFSRPGTYTIRARATDRDGASGGVATRTVTLGEAAQSDTTPPDTAIISQLSATTRNSSPSFGFASTEPGSSFQCRLDDDGWSACSSRQAYFDLADGPHSFEVRARDAAGNVDPTPASRSFLLTTEVVDPEIAVQRRQVQKGRLIKVKLGAGAADAVVARAAGRVVLKGKRTRSFRLPAKRKRIEPGAVRTLRLKPPRRRQSRKIFTALGRGRDVRARVRVKLTDRAGNTVRERRVVRLRAARR